MPRTRQQTNSAVHASSCGSDRSCAAYVRLSVLDNGVPDGDSIENQIQIIEHFIEGRPELQPYVVYQDNGYTGTHFERPAWERLMAAAYEGKVGCIIVKDLSRIGRNYIEVGSFIERDCPRLGIRLISVNDRYDSASVNSSDEQLAVLKNVINDYYAKDISRKVCSALATKRRLGQFLGSYAPYGYQKDPNDKNHLLIDPETAPVVRRIFELRAMGTGYGTILKTLNEEGVASPGRYRYEHGIITNNNKKGEKLLWNRHILAIILSNIVYLGHVAQGKSRSSLYEGKEEHSVAESEWVYAYNTHEPIIEEALFQAVQAVNQQRKREYFSYYGKYKDTPKQSNPYGERLICADCGRQLKLIRYYSQNGDKSYSFFDCPSFLEHGELACRRRAIRCEDLNAAVLEALKAQIVLLLDKNKVLRKLMELSAKKKDREEEKQAILTKLRRKKDLAAACYSDWKEGLLNEEEYHFLRESYHSDIARLQEQLSELTAVQDSGINLSSEAEYWKKLIKQHRGMKTLTKEMVQTLIKIIVLNSDGLLQIEFAFSDSLAEMNEVIEKIKREVA